MNILNEIAESTKARLARQKAARPLAKLQNEAAGIHRGFAFEKALATPGMAFICEVKRASPSKGMIAQNFPYRQIAREYEAAGAAAISVLTEPEYFKGSPRYLAEIAGEVSLPLLRKDFILDEYQIYEAALLGAGAVLLIAALLDDENLARFLALAETMGLSCLAEAHTEEELHRALAAGARVLGVNNRNLADFTVDFENSLRLRALCPKEVLFVAESGVHTAQDVAKLKDGGVDAVLVGEALMRSADKKAALTALRGAAL